MMDDNIRKWCLKLSFSFVRGVLVFNIFYFIFYFILFTLFFILFFNIFTVDLIHWPRMNQIHNYLRYLIHCRRFNS